ncbi:MAG: amidohydrolase family protein [Chloroflexi bacterium]|nr:amidohydrolase family protein [Chloroflexota bacterium]
MNEFRIAADRLVDGTGAPAREGIEVVVRDGRIAALEPARADSGARRYPGATLLPGLVDAHVHLSLPGDGRTYEQMALDTDARMVEHGLRNAALHLAAGVTTVRDNGARNRLGFAIRDLIAAGAPGPRVLASGRPVTQRGGHFWWCGAEADTEGECREAVDRLVAEGADHIKLMASGGGTAGTDPGAASYSVAALATIIGRARDHGRRTTAHCRAAGAVERALDADVDCIEHVEFLTSDGSARRDPALVRRLTASDTWLSPTLQAFAGPDLARRLDDVRAFLDAGMEERILFGTDAGPFDVPFGQAAFGVQLLAQAGMTPLQAIAAATSRPALALGVEADAGTIAPGRRADLLIVEGDPSRDLDTLERVVAVYQGGRLVIGA